MHELLSDLSKVWVANIAANVIAFLALDTCQDILAIVTGGLAALYTLVRIHQCVTGRTVLESWRRHAKRNHVK